MDLDADVVVVGAGVAGLTTAYSLLQKNPSLIVTVLEATGKTPGFLLTPILSVRQNRRSRPLHTPPSAKQDLQVVRLGGSMDKFAADAAFGPSPGAGDSNRAKKRRRKNRR